MTIAHASSTVNNATVAAAFTPTYQLPSTEVINSNALEGDQCDAEYIFNTDGTIQERRESLGTNPLTTSASSPWSDDPAEDGTGKYVRMVHLGGTNRRVDVLGEGWLQLNVQRLFDFNNPNTSGPFADASTYTVDISLDGSTVHDTQTLTVNLDNQGP